VIHDNLRTAIKTAHKQGRDILENPETAPDHLIQKLRPA